MRKREMMARWERSHRDLLHTIELLAASERGLSTRTAELEAQLANREARIRWLESCLKRIRPPINTFDQ